MTLDLPPSPDRTLLRDSVQRFLADSPRPGWRALTETLGLGGVTAPEAAGGFGGGAIDIAMVAAELGPALAGADWVSHAAATWLIGQLTPDHASLANLASGSRRAAIISSATAAAVPAVERGIPRGAASLVAGGAEADLFLLADGEAILLFAADGDKVEQRHRIMHDGSVTADLALALKTTDVELLASGAEARAAADHAVDLILSARCAEAVGLMQAMIAASADYLGQRSQFGRPIGSFQVLRHRAADMQLALMKAAALTEVAILAVDSASAERSQMVSAACVEVTDAVRIVGEGAVQLHGAMGLTEELSLGGQFKRALAIAAALGPQTHHFARFADATA